MRKATDRPNTTAHLEFGPTGVRVRVPVDAAGESRALVEALNTNPALRARAAKARNNQAAGRGIAGEDVQNRAAERCALGLGVHGGPER